MKVIENKIITRFRQWIFKILKQNETRQPQELQP